MPDEPRPGYDTQRDYEHILEAQLQEGLSTLRRPWTGQFFSAISCGLDLGFGPFMLVVMLTILGPEYGPVTNVAMGAVYTFGFVFVILGRSELFTEHTTLAVLPYLQGLASFRELAGLWFWVYWGNFLGGLGIAVLIWIAGPAIGVVDPSALRSVATTFTHMGVVGVFTGSLLAGWLMGLLSWILTSVGDTISRIVVIFVATFVIGFAHLPHCVAGNIEVVAGMLAGAPISVAAWAQFLAVTTVGNSIGGVVFVTLVKHSHITRGSDEPEIDVTQEEFGDLSITDESTDANDGAESED